MKLYPFIFTAILVVMLLPDVHAQDEDGFGVRQYQIGIGIAPLGITDKNDLDSFIEYGASISAELTVPENLWVRLSMAYADSYVKSPPELLSEGDFNILRTDLFILYGGSLYGGIGIGYYSISHDLSQGAIEAFQDLGLEAEESVDNSLAFSLKAGVKSGGDIGYFIEATVSQVPATVTSTITDSKTGLSATAEPDYTITIASFFQIGIYLTL
ncbi:MAG: hypothetical protein CL946_13270 [Ectothiorhodospiraceae bacterium]|nr:hypothetical protein [Ectothiorhodospiraceae bacterium]